MITHTTLGRAAKALGRSALERFTSAKNLDRMTIAVLICHVALKIVCFLHMKDTELTGDEWYSVTAAQALGASTRSVFAAGEFDLEPMVSAVVCRGWFMPGMPLLLTPLTILDPDPSLGQIRLHTGSLTLILFLWSVGEVRRKIGRGYALALAFFLGLSPMWTLFSLTTWGDLTSGLLIAILATKLVGHGNLLTEGNLPTARQAIQLGAIASATVLMRSSALPTVSLTFLLLAVLAALSLQHTARIIRAFGRIALSGVIFFALLLPWSFLVSTVFKEAVLTTTTLPLAFGITFGKHEALCDGPCPEGNIWLSSFEYSTRKHTVTGEKVLSVQREMAREALADFTWRGYFHQVKWNSKHYYLYHSQFMDRFLGSRTDGANISFLMRKRAYFDSWTRLLYLSSLSVFSLAAIWVVWTGVKRQILSLTLKALALATMVQPLVHISHGRYWPIFGSLLALSVPFVLTTKLRHRQAPRQPGVFINERLLVVAQMVAVTPVLSFYIMLIVT